MSHFLQQCNHTYLCSAVILRTSFELRSLINIRSATSQREDNGEQALNNLTHTLHNCILIISLSIYEWFYYFITSLITTTFLHIKLTYEITKLSFI